MELLSSAPSMTSASSARVSSPCIPETHEHAPTAALAPEGRAANKGEVDRTDFDHQGGTDPAEAKEKSFHTAAARVIMEVTHAARMARPDLLRSTAYLARFLTKWTEEHDKRLHRLMSYINNSLAYPMYA